jgi:ABC-type lipoprotein release transport system permease subunit
MKQLLMMAFRDLGRNRRRSFFSALALGMGVSLLLLMAAVIEGEMRGSMDTTIRLQSGHLQVRALSYEDGKTSLAWEDLIEDPDQIAAKIASLPVVQVATPRLFASGIVSAGDESVGVSIIGIDPSSPANQPYIDGLTGGEFIQADDREGILVGQTLADNIGLQVGDSVNLQANTSDGEVDGQNFTIRGIYSTGTPSYDQSTVFLPILKAQSLTRADNHASTIFVLLDDREQTDGVVAALKSDRYQVETWEQANEFLIQTEQFSRGYMVVLYLIVLGITATVVVNALIMAVFERTREIGILAAIGMRSSRILSMFLAESSLLAVGGILIGLILGGLMVLYATNVGFYIGNFGATGILLGERIYGYLTLEDTLSLTLLAFIVTILAGLYPAVLAARMEPVEALHGGKQA